MFRSKHRALLILGLLAIFIIIALVEKTISAPEADPFSDFKYPATIEIYTTDATAHLSAEVQVFDQGDNMALEPGQADSWFRVSVSASKATRVLIVTNGEPILYPQLPANRFTEFTKMGGSPVQYLGEVDVPANRRVNLGSFVLTPDLIEINHKRLVARLPVITADPPDLPEEDQPDGFPQYANYVLYGTPGAVIPTFGIGAPMSSSGQLPPKGSKGRSYYPPADFAAKESYLFIADYLAQATITYNAPSTGSAGQQNYTWTGASRLAPRLAATSNGVIEGRNDAAFISGIFFGAAAAALLALAQELTDNFWSPIAADRIDARKSAAILRHFRNGGAIVT